MVLIATTTDGHAAAMKCELPPNAEDLRRLSGLIAASPALADAVWTSKEGGEVR
jgi:hypothetical protein